MKNLKFFVLLHTLDKKEIASFDKYLKQSHGGEHVALRIFKYVRRVSLSNPNLLRLGLENIHTGVFGPIPDNASERKKSLKNILNTLSDLYKWLKEFLLVNKLAQDSWEQQMTWLSVLRDRGLKEEHDKLTRLLLTTAHGSSLKDVGNYLRLFNAACLHFQNLASTGRRPDIIGLEECFNAMYTSSDILRLRMECFIFNAKKVLPLQVTLSSPPFPPSKVKEEEPLLSLYRYLHRLLLEEQESDYSLLENFMSEYATQIHKDELHGIFGYLQNYAAMQIRNGKESIFYEKAHHLNKFGLQHGFFSQSGIITHTQFTNIVTAACSAKDFDWAEDFILEHYHLLPENGREDVLHLSDAIINFEKEDFPNALIILEQLILKDLHLSIRAKLMILRIYYDCKVDSERIIDFCTNFEAILYRNRKPQTGAVESALKFIRLVRMLILEKTDREILIADIESAPNLYYRSWLRKQVANYKGRYVTRKRSPRVTHL